MVNAIKQEFFDEFSPVRIDKNNGAGEIVTIVDWQAEADAFPVVNSVNLRYSFTLEYLNCTYYLPSLNRIPTSNLPITKLAETDTSKQAKMVEFKRKYGTAENFAIQFILWRWINGDWRKTYSARDTLYYLGLEGYIDLIYPYLRSEQGIIFGSTRHKLGISIAPNFLKDDDYLEISGGYSGYCSYVLEEGEVELESGNSGSKTVGKDTVILLGSSSRRAALYVCNAGDTRLYFLFNDNYNALVVPRSPFLEPGESLTCEHGKIIYSGGNQHLIPALSQRSIIKLTLLVARESGIGEVTYQELYFPLIS